MFADLLYRLKSLAYRRRAEDELETELRFHIEEQAARYVSRGIPEGEALRRARLDLNGPEQVKESCRDARGTRLVENILHDLSYGVRMLRKDRGYTMAAIAALAVGIGANAVLFTIFNATVLKPLPVPDRDRIVSIYRTSAQIATGTFSFADYAAFRDRSTALAGIAIEQPAHLRMLTGGAAEAAMGVFVSANYLSVYGVRPVAGRPIDATEERRTAPPFPTLISDNYWERRFARDPAVLGKAVTVSGIPMQIVGVTPPDFMGTRPDVPDLWPLISAVADPRQRERDHTTICCALTARLKPGVTVAQAQAELSSIAAAERRDFPSAEPWGVRVEPAAPFGSARRPFQMMYVVLQAAMALVLLIACSNVAGLLLGRAATRQKEIALRLAIGATRGRIVGQLLTEGILIAMLAGAAALLLTWQSLAAVLSLMARASSEGGTIVLNVAPDVRVVLYLVMLSAVAGISFALAPALQATRPDVIAAIKEDAGFTGSRRKARLRGWMLAGQVAVCLALLIGAGMLAASSVRMMTVDPGFDTHGVIVASLGPPSDLDYSGARQLELRDRLRRRIAELPGVVALSSTSHIPLANNVRVTRVGTWQSPVPYSYVTADYFRSLNLPLLRGRSFTAAEVTGDAPVAVVSDALARRLWPGEDPVGKRIPIGSASADRSAGELAPLSSSTEIVGVARDVRNVSPIAADDGFVYLPKPPGTWDSDLLVRYAGDRAAISAAVLNSVRNAESRLPVNIRTLEGEIAHGEIAVMVRIGAIIFAAIGLIGFGLASVGVYSMAGYTVSRQTRDVGIRMALGAGKYDVLRFLLADTMRWITAGLFAGVILGIAISRVLGSMMHGLQLLDPLVLIGVCGATAAFALLAAWFPARRAAKLDPAITLRTS